MKPALAAPLAWEAGITIGEKGSIELENMGGLGASTTGDPEVSDGLDPLESRPWRDIGRVPSALAFGGPGRRLGARRGPQGMSASPSPCDWTGRGVRDINPGM